mmetsp:Transcript_21518/g.52354  ORF Transcript_21518/g.52354 Transcript_21518/m.52354 type:complete len:467 (+) Transcript_21518:82-1482(+)
MSDPADEINRLIQSAQSRDHDVFGCPPGSFLVRVTAAQVYLACGLCPGEPVLDGIDEAERHWDEYGHWQEDIPDDPRVTIQREMSRYACPPTRQEVAVATQTAIRRGLVRPHPSTPETLHVGWCHKRDVRLFCELCKEWMMHTLYTSASHSCSGVPWTECGPTGNLDRARDPQVADRLVRGALGVRRGEQQPEVGGLGPFRRRQQPPQEDVTEISVDQSEEAEICVQDPVHARGRECARAMIRHALRGAVPGPALGSTRRTAVDAEAMSGAPPAKRRRGPVVEVVLSDDDGTGFIRQVSATHAGAASARRGAQVPVRMSGGVSSGRPQSSPCAHDRSGFAATVREAARKAAESTTQPTSAGSRVSQLHADFVLLGDQCAEFDRCRPSKPSASNPAARRNGNRRDGVAEWSPAPLRTASKGLGREAAAFCSILRREIDAVSQGLRTPSEIAVYHELCACLQDAARRT